MSGLGVRSLRAVSRLRDATRSGAGKRWTHTGTTSGSSTGARTGLMAVAAGVAGVAGAYAAYTLKSSETKSSLNSFIPVAYAAGKLPPPSQPSVFSPTKEHALYLWIHLSSKADQKACAKAVADLEAYCDAVSPKDLRDESNEVVAGVGFGPELYLKVVGRTLKRYGYVERKGPLGAMPAKGGDIFVHAKSDNVSKLFELAQLVLAKLPPGSVAKFEDTYSFVYRNGRDLTGFIDGTENPADEDSRRTIGVEPSTGGSYVITQKWIHKLDIIGTEKVQNLEKFVGRTQEDSTELKNKSVSSHVARMTGGTALGQKKVFEIARQSMPYGNLHDKAGLFFIAYAASPENFDYMLDRMVGVDKDGHSDDIMRLTECVASTYWYFPSVAELKKMKG